MHVNLGRPAVRIVQAASSVGALSWLVRLLCTQRRRGTLGDFPTWQRPRAEVVDEWVWLRSTGCTREQAAARMSMGRGALDRALARAAGDVRGVSCSCTWSGPRQVVTGAGSWVRVRRGVA